MERHQGGVEHRPVALERGHQRVAARPIRIEVFPPLEERPRGAARAGLPRGTLRRIEQVRAERHQVDDAIQAHCQRVGPGDAIQVRHRRAPVPVRRIDAGLQQRRRQARVELDPVGTGLDLRFDHARHLVRIVHGHGQARQLGIVDHRAGVEGLWPGQRAACERVPVARGGRQVAAGIAYGGDAESDQSAGVVRGDGVVGQRLHDHVRTLAHDFRRPEGVVGVHVDQARQQVAATEVDAASRPQAGRIAGVVDPRQAPVLDPHAARRAGARLFDIDQVDLVERQGPGVRPRIRGGVCHRRGHDGRQQGGKHEVSHDEVASGPWVPPP